MTDARGNVSQYELNGNGSTTRLEEPPARVGRAPKVTLAQWAADDIYKVQEQDALGRVTKYEHNDGRGNLTADEVFADATLVTSLKRTQYTYHPTFNKPTSQTDAEGRTATWTLDAATGDLLSQTDAVGNTTVHTYDADGQMLTTTDARGFVTTYSNHTDYGRPQSSTNALQQVTTMTYDTRGRDTRKVEQPYGRVTEMTYDGFDRPTRVVRRAEAVSGPGDEITETAYYPGGQAQSVTNALGGITTITLDGLNRVVGTSITVGTETLTMATEYDGNGNKERERDRRGVWRRHVYDARNLEIETRIEQGLVGEGPTGVIATFDYDAVDNKVRDRRGGAADRVRVRRAQPRDGQAVAGDDAAGLHTRRGGSRSARRTTTWATCSRAPTPTVA